jgi:hypothetical protein
MDEAKSSLSDKSRAFMPVDGMKRELDSSLEITLKLKIIISILKYLYKTDIILIIQNLNIYYPYFG